MTETARNAQMEENVPSMLDFTDKVVLVTGAGAGIGAAVAKGFAAQGAHAVVHYNRNAEGAKAVQAAIEEAGGRASVVSADLTDPDAAAALVRQLVDDHGRIDVLVNNAGDLVKRSAVAEMPDDDYRYIMDLNITSVFRLCREVVPVMKRAGGGAVVNLTSVAASTGGAGGSVIYATSKGAVSTFTKGLAKELATDGIRVNALSPGIIETPFHDRNTSGEQMQRMVSGIPMGRAGSPEECVGTVLFLASDEMSGYVTGQIIEVNGGQLTP